MEVQNGTWAEQMDIVEEGLNTSIHATHPIDPLSFTFSLNLIMCWAHRRHPLLQESYQPPNRPL